MKIDFKQAVTFEDDLNTYINENSNCAIYMKSINFSQIEWK